MVNEMHINYDRYIAIIMMMIITTIAPKGMNMMILKDISVMVLMRIFKAINEKTMITTF